MKAIEAMIVAAMMIHLVGCGQLNRKAADQPTNGTAVLMFPEWARSDSAYERLKCTNFYAVYSNAAWFTRELQPDGTLAQYWKRDDGEETIEDARRTFGINIQWNVNKALYDALSQ